MTRATSFLVSTLGIANNNNTEDDRAKEEMGGAGRGWGDIEMSTTHTISKKLIGRAIFNVHFCIQENDFDDECDCHPDPTLIKHPIWGCFCISNHNLILHSYSDTHH